MTNLLLVNFIFFQVALADVKPQLLPLDQMLTSSESISAKAALERLFTSKEIQTEWFAPEFLAQVPIEQVRGIIDGVKSQQKTKLFQWRFFQL
ncbi:MAG: hypothetical protein V7K85_31715 [Nostoc sp.]